jgi:dTDP-4-amino-4,6-dideoxygalactose transaminase
LGYRAGNFSKSEEASRQVLALPVYPELTRDMLDFTADAVLEFVCENQPKSHVRA